MSAKPPAIVYDHEPAHILIADVASGQLRPAAQQDWLVLSSGHAPWRDSLLVEQYRRPPFQAPEHASHAHHVCIRLSPSSIGEWWIAGEQPRRQRVTPGDVHLTSADVPMWYRLQESSEILMLALAPSFMQHAAHEFTGVAAIELRNQRAIRDAPILHLGLALQAELQAGCPAGRLYGEGLATALAVHVLQHYAVCPPQLRSYRGGMPQARLQRVLEYMQAHLDHELSLAAVAQMSLYYFSRLFKQSTGLSPHQYILQQRIAWATRLLVKPQLSVAAIGYRVGFASQAHFTTIFRRWVGTTPRQYRQQRLTVTPTRTSCAGRPPGER